MSDKTELKPCPFCGSPGNVAGDEFNGHSSYYATCTSVDCFCCVGEAWDRDALPDHQFATEQQAAEAWNKRAIPYKRVEPVADGDPEPDCLLY